MKNTLKQLTIFTLITISYIYILYNINYIKDNITYILKVSINNIIPTLFPTIFITNILLNTKIPYIINKYLKINPIYILSILTGSPTNAYILNNYDIDKTKYLSLTNYPSLIFIYNYLTIIFNKNTSIILILTNIISNIILFFIIKSPKINYQNNNNIPITTLIPESIKKSTFTTLNIIASVALYSILPTSLISNIYLKSMLLSVTEITSSLNNLSIINIPLNIKLLFTIISISTTGLCIQTQILSITNNFNIKEYIKNRLLHLVIYLLINFIIFLLI